MIPPRLFPILTVLIAGIVASSAQAAPGEFGRAGQITIPKIEFRDATVAETIRFLEQKGRQLDPEKKGVNLVLKAAPEVSERRISLSLTAVPLSEVVRYIAELAGLQVSNDTRVIYIHPKGDPAPSVGTPPPLARPMWKKLNQIVIPRLELRDASVKETVEFIKAKTDQMTKGQVPFNVVVKLPEVEAPAPPAPKPESVPGLDIPGLPNAAVPGIQNERRVTLSVADLPVADVLRYVAALGDMQIEVREHAVVLSAKPKADAGGAPAK